MGEAAAAVAAEGVAEVLTEILLQALRVHPQGWKLGELLVGSALAQRKKQGVAFVWHSFKLACWQYQKWPELAGIFRARFAR
jgi:hypothetical protein